jgi:hypothetical protein
MMQLAREELLSLAYLTQNAPIVFPFGLRNAAGMVGHLTAQRMHPPPLNDEFVGMVEYITESFYDLLTGDSEGIAESNSSRGSHHPSRECFMAKCTHRAETLKGHIANVHERDVTLPSDPDNGVRADGRVLPNPWLEQLRAWQQELEDARLQLEQEHAENEHKVTCHGDGGCACSRPAT